MSALHWRWLSRSAHTGDVLSAYGAGLVVLGVLIGSRPYLRTGFRKLAESQGSAKAIVFSAQPGEDINEAIGRAKRAKVAAALPDIIDERVVAVLVIIAGTLLNGWGSPLARRWGLPV